MPKFGKRSKRNLETCHRDLRIICNEAIKYFDFSVIYGIRSEEEQFKLFNEGKSQLDGIHKKSKHQGRKCEKLDAGVDEEHKILTDEDGDAIASFAVDLMPYYKGFNPFTNESGTKLFYYQAGLIMGIAARLYEEGKIKHTLRWGGNWDNDMDFFGDSHFFDLPHFELVIPKK